MENSISEVTRRLGFKDAEVFLLAGDASTRKYYRVRHSKGSVILMKDSPFDDQDPNVQSMKAYADMGINVPLIEAVFPEEGVVVQQDIGDVHLQLITDRAALEKYYKQAVDILLTFQRRALEYGKSGKDIYPTRIKFTHEKFMSELNMTTEFYLSSFKGKTPPSSLSGLYEEIVTGMMEQPFLLQHRDYHSRNLMVKDGELYVIDIQDSRMGPFTYDVASLVIDPYIQLDDSLYEQIINDYYEGIKDIVNCSYQEYRRYYDLCFLQRGIKILGTFAYQKIKRDNPGYLKYIPCSIQKIKDVSKSFPEWEEVILRDLLS